MKKKRKWLVVLLAAIMVFTMTPMAVFASEDDGTFKDSNGIRYLITGENTVSVVSNTDDPLLGVGMGQATYRGEITIPDTVTDGDNSYTVTEIGGMAFYRTDITKITIPSSVTRIESLAFYNCHSLTKIIIPESGLLKIGDNAFESCDKLSSFSLPSTVTTIGSAAFGNCRELKSLHIPAGVTDGLVKALVGNTLYPYLENVTIEEESPYEIEGGVLYRGTEAHLYMGPETDVVLREGTTKIADDQYNVISGIQGAFAQTYDLKSITIPEGVTSIPANAFNSAVNLESVILPDGLQEIGARAFYNTGLLSIELPDSVETIGNSAFQGTIHMTSAKLPSNLKSMGEGAFCDAYVLESIVVPEGITEIPAEAFAGCEKLQTIVIPKNVSSIGKNAFENAFKNVESATLIFQGETPPTIDTQLWGEENKPNLTIIVPTGSEGAYADVDCLKDYMTDGENSTVHDQDYSLTLSDDIKVCPDDTAALDIKYELPVGAALEFSSDNENVLTVDKDGKVTGKAEDTAVVTAKITINGITLISDTCTVTVGHNFENGKCTLCGEEDPNYIPPVDPTDPTQPGAGEGDNQGGQNNDNQTATTDKSAQTGDDINMLPLAALMTLAAIGAAGTVLYGRRKEQ